MSRASPFAVLAVFALGAVACGTPRYAIIDGRKVERPSVGYTDGDRFSIVHRRAFPDVASAGRSRDVDDGRIIGRVCGLDVSFDASWYGDRVSLIGRADAPWIKDFMQTEGLFQLLIQVTEPSLGHRRIVGTVPGLSNYRIDIDASADALVAKVNRRRFQLAADGRDLVGHMQDSHMAVAGDVPREIDVPYVIAGREALATMLPADEAVILVLMLSCNGVSVAHEGQLVHGFSLVRPAGNGSR
ncbi:MAG: hypothetical protein JWN44_210 [Myxococcales bacterium]|nr:hypothetical protein [Myxococcales bacterium]